MRIQLLLLPLEDLDGDRSEQPFALVVDQYDGMPTENDMEVWERFREKCGARAGVLTPDTVEIRQEHYSTPLTLERVAGPMKCASSQVEKIRDLVKAQGVDGTWNFSPYMRGLFNGFELALSVLEGERPPVYRDEPEDGYLCDRPDPDTSGPEFASQAAGDADA